MKKHFALIVVIIGIGIFCFNKIVSASDGYKYGTETVFFYGNEKEDQILNAMHTMTHQKVVAEEKWGYTLMSDENINIIYKELIGSDFNNKELMLSIIEKWGIGDFSNIDSDHNVLWEALEGTEGRASGILTEVQETKLIHYNFNK